MNAHSSDPRDVRSRALSQLAMDETQEKLTQNSQILKQARDSTEREKLQEENEKLKKQLVQLQVALTDAPPMFVKPNGIYGNFKDLQIIDGSIDEIGKFLVKWGETKRKPEQTTKPNKFARLKFWQNARKLYLSEEFFGPIKNTLEEMGREKRGRKNQKRAKIEAQPTESEDISVETSIQNLDSDEVLAPL